MNVGVPEEDQIHRTPALRAQALDTVSRYDRDPLYTPASQARSGLCTRPRSRARPGCAPMTPFAGGKQSVAIPVGSAAVERSLPRSVFRERAVPWLDHATSAESQGPTSGSVLA